MTMCVCMCEHPKTAQSLGDDTRAVVGPKRAPEVGFDSVMWFAVGVHVGRSVDRWTSKDAGNRPPPTPFMERTGETEIKLIV